MRRAAVVLVVLAVAAGCSSTPNPEDEETRRWAREIRVLRPESLGDRQYAVLAELEERVRIGAMGERAAQDEAERSMRWRAAKIDADAVVLADCSRIQDPDDWEARTTPTLRCIGYAINWTGH